MYISTYKDWRRQWDPIHTDRYHSHRLHGTWVWDQFAAGGISSYISSSVAWCELYNWNQLFPFQTLPLVNTLAATLSTSVNRPIHQSCQIIINHKIIHEMCGVSISLCLFVSMFAFIYRYVCHNLYFTHTGTCMWWRIHLTSIAYH